jgi:hypothetical protein
MKKKPEKLGEFQCIFTYLRQKVVSSFDGTGGHIYCASSLPPFR